nr:uncharacterized protein LOC105759122 isoform X2 [Taeniopygia guttata]
MMHGQLAAVFSAVPSGEGRSARQPGGFAVDSRSVDSRAVDSRSTESRGLAAPPAPRRPRGPSALSRQLRALHRPAPAPAPCGSAAGKTTAGKTTAGKTHLCGGSRRSCDCFTWRERSTPVSHSSTVSPHSTREFGTLSSEVLAQDESFAIGTRKLLKRKLAVAGDHPCGKICFIFALCHEHLPKSCEPMLTLLTQR